MCMCMCVCVCVYVTQFLALGFVLEKHLRKKKDLFISFMGTASACDRVDRIPVLVLHVYGQQR